MIQGIATAVRRMRFVPFKRRGATPHNDTSNERTVEGPIESARTARAMAEALERAINERNFTEAQHLAAAALPYCARHEHVRLQVARLRLAEGDPEQALTLIDRGHPVDDQTRLLRIVCQLQTGRISQAHVDLLHWNALHKAPQPARLMLGLLEAAPPAATHDDFTFMNQAHQSDMRSRPELAVLAMARGRSEQAVQCAERVVQHISPAAMDPMVRLLLQSMGLLPSMTPIVSETHETALADELAEHEHAIAPLIEAQRHQPTNAAFGLLLGAIDRALPGFAEPVTVCALVADLLIERNEHDEAREWIIRGVEYGPMSLTMHRLQQQVDADTDTHRQSDTQHVLATVGSTESSAARRAKGMAA